MAATVGFDDMPSSDVLTSKQQHGSVPFPGGEGVMSHRLAGHYPSNSE
jgi:hypothetical protein